MEKVERLLKELGELNEVSAHETEEMNYIYQLLREKVDEIKILNNQVNNKGCPKQTAFIILRYFFIKKVFL